MSIDSKSIRSSDVEIQLPNYAHKRSPTLILVEKINKLVAIRRQFVIISLTVIISCLTLSGYLISDCVSFFQSPKATEITYYPREHTFFFTIYNFMSIFGGIVGCLYLYKYPFDTESSS